MQMTAAELQGHSHTPPALERKQKPLKHGTPPQTAAYLFPHGRLDDGTQPRQQIIQRLQDISLHRPVTAHGVTQDFVHSTNGIRGMLPALNQNFLCMRCDETQEIHMKVFRLSRRSIVVPTGTQGSDTVTALRFQCPVHEITICQHGILLPAEAAEPAQQGCRTEKRLQMARRTQEKMVRMRR